MTSELLLVPPEVLMGEAGMCSLWAMAAIARVFQQNQHMNGWQPPNMKAILVASLWPILPDTSAGANYVFSTQDLEMDAVREIIGDAKPRVVWRCVAGGALNFYYLKEK